VQGIGGRTILHRIMGTPEAISTEYFQKLLENRRITVQLTGIWTRTQGLIRDERFEVIAATNDTLFIRRPGDIKVYTVGRGGTLSISKAKVTPMSEVKAEQRIVTISFANESWKNDLGLRFPKSMVSGRVNTFAKAPTFTIDEHQTIRRFGDYLELTHAPMELVDIALDNHTLTGTLHIRYWKMGLN
jgi:hypothetical protein